MRYNLVDKTTTGVVTAVTFRDDMPRLFIRMTRADGESAMEAMTVLFLELGEVQVMQQLEGYCAWMKTVAKRMCAEVTLIPLDEIVIPEHKMTQAELDALHSYGPDGVPLSVVEDIRAEIAEREEALRFRNSSLGGR